MINSAIDSFQYWIGKVAARGLHLQRESESGVSMLFHYQYWFSFFFPQHAPSAVGHSMKQLSAPLQGTQSVWVSSCPWLLFLTVAVCIQIMKVYH